MTEICPQRMSPDLQRKVDANRASRLGQENAMKAQIKAQVSLKLRLCLLGLYFYSIFGAVNGSRLRKTRLGGPPTTITVMG